MVYLREVINSWKEELLNDSSVHTYCYYYINDRKHLDKLCLLTDGDENAIATKGYKGIKVDSAEINKVIKKYSYKGINFSNNIFRLLGIYLANEKEVQSYLEAKYNLSPIQFKYIISRFIPECRDKLIEDLLQNKLSKEQHVFSNLVRFVYLDFEESILDNITNLVRSDCPDVIDLILLEDIEKKLIARNVTEIKYLNKSESDIILSILQNFSNAIKRITSNRRKDHPVFKISDEYDVQDVLYVMLKGIFPNLIIEEPTPQVAGKYNRIDLCIPTASGAVFIEVKMIKEKNNNEKEFIGQLKDDIQSYYKYQDLKELIFFIYDPQNKTTDRTSFSDLDGQKTINGITFNVKTILSV